MKKKKLLLVELKVKSFKTDLKNSEKNNLKGGNSANCNPSENFEGNCPPQPQPTEVNCLGPSAYCTGNSCPFHSCTCVPPGSFEGGGDCDPSSFC